jgi:hypothetical protein
MLNAPISNLPPGLKRSPPVPEPPAEPQPPSPVKHPLAVLPPERAVLNVRPHAKTSGPRHVPILASANGIPFLRLTKPQPPALSRVLRQKLNRRIERFHRRVLLTNYWLPIGQEEDKWDDILRKECGFNDDYERDIGRQPGHHGHDNGGVPQRSVKWTDIIRQAIKENEATYAEDLKTDRVIAKKMLDIVDEETRLAKLEGQTVVRGRKRRPIKSRWLT